jgi:PAS domain S-box-containing protein
MIDPTIAMVGSYDYRLVALSIVIAIFASYAALDLAGRTTAARGRGRLAWLIGGATAMGVGIWSMHYIGMLAFTLPVTVLYDWPTVLLSLLAAVFAAAVALFVVSRPKMGWLRALTGSAIMGTGIATMHYTGMAAMRLPAMCSYNPLLLTLSVVFAIAISLVALRLTFRFREDRKATGWRKAASAIVMGAAIPVMHYTGMAAARFMPSTVIPDTSHTVSTSILSIAGVSVVTLLVLGVAVLTSAVGRRFSAQAFQLRENEKRVLAITQTAPDAIVSADSDGRITYFNPAAEHIFGYSSSEVSGQPLSLLMPERFKSAHQKGLERYRATREAHVIGKSVELAGRRKDGSEFPLSLSLSAWEANGETFFTGILRDITERKRAEEALKQSEERFRLLVEGVKDYAIFSLTPDGHVASWNLGAERIKGYRADEIIGRHFSCFYPEEDIRNGKPEQELRIATSEGRVADEGWRVRKDGSKFWASAVITPLSEGAGRMLGFSKITRDITERKRAEEALQVSEERFSSAFEHAAIGMALVASDGRWLKVNRALCNLLGYSSEELLAKRFQDITYPDDLEADLEYVRQMLASEIRTYQMEKRYFHKLGHIVWALLSVSMVRDERSQELYFISQTQDITERKRVEDEIKDLSAQMERQNTELIEINKELESFSYSVSHDLRAPLRAIDGFSLALLEDCDHKLDPAEKEHLRRVRGATANMGRLIDDMLNLARTARYELVRGKVDLSALAREIVSAFQETEPARGATCVIAPDVIVEGDRTLLRVVLENLLGNAWKFTSKQPDAHIEFGVQSESGRTVYFVRDNGAGFDMRYADKLFGVFQRLHDGREFQGSGVGLATVQRIVHRHGGRIWAGSTVGEGATFYFVLDAGGPSRASVDVPRGSAVLSEKSTG